MDYGRVRLWGSIAFVIGSALVGKLVSLYDYRAILALLTLGIASMLLGMLLRPSVMPQGESRHQESAGWPARRSLVAQSWRFPACVCLLQGRMRPITASAPSTGRGGLLGFCGRLPVVARRGSGGHYLRAEPKTVPSFRGA